MGKSKRKYEKEYLDSIKKDYVEKINELIEKCKDPILLDFVYKFLIKTI